MSSRSRSNLKVLSKKALLSRKEWLDSINNQVEVPEYIPSDPVSFMHAFDRKEDQLLAGFFAAIMAWGRRDIVLSKVHDLLSRMDYHPEAFIRGYSDADFHHLQGFRHRTFTAEDVNGLVRCLQQALHHYGDFESFWKYVYLKAGESGLHLMDLFHEEFFGLVPETPVRTRKHIASKKKKSTCKRLWLFLRWSLRKNSVVDPGLMDFMPVSELMIPFDVHVARQARRLGLLGRKQNDWLALQELHKRLCILNPQDPARYDYALFGLGVMKLNVPAEYLLNPKAE